MTIRAEQKEKRKEEILITALNLFVEKGYAFTKTSEISKSLNISEGLLFHYFKTKELLLEALVDIALAENDSWIDQDSLDPIMYLEHVATAVFQCLKEDEEGAKFFMLIAQLKQKNGIPKQIYEKLQGKEQNIHGMINIIKRGQQMETIRQGDPYTLAYLFTNVLQAIAIQHAQHRELPFPEVDWILDLLRNHSKN